jgi:hypothetical protein
MLTTSEYRELSAKTPHGTHARYNAHTLAGEEACDPCREAERIYRAKLRARHLSQDEDEQPRHRSFAWPPYLRTEDEEIEDEEIEDEDEDEDERSWADDLEEAEDEQEVEEEEYEADDQPMLRGRESSMWHVGGGAWDADFMRGSGGVLGFLNVATPHRSVRARASSPQEEIPAVPGVGLRAITTKLDSQKPHGKEAVALLAKAGEYLKPATLRQYGEARGCDPEDIATAERIVVGKGKGR